MGLGISVRRLRGLLEDEDREKPDGDELRTNIAIEDEGSEYSAWHEGKQIAGGEWDEMIAGINAWMEKEKFFPSVYYVNERGNIETVNPETGEYIGQGWV
jgi:hypothetical protein